MSDDAETEDPASRRARLKAARRSRKRGPRPMGMSGRSVFLIKKLVAERAKPARRKRRRS